MRLSLSLCFPVRAAAALLLATLLVLCSHPLCYADEPDEEARQELKEESSKADSEKQDSSKGDKSDKAGEDHDDSPVDSVIPIEIIAPMHDGNSVLVRFNAEIEDIHEVTPGKAVDIEKIELNEDGKLTVDHVLRNVVVKAVHKIRSVPDELSPVKQRQVTVLIKRGELTRLRAAGPDLRLVRSKTSNDTNPFTQVINNFSKNLFQPLLLFFFMGFLVPILKVPFEFPKALYQSLTIYLLISIGWHGGVLMASQPPSELRIAGGFAVVGFFANMIVGVVATILLRLVTRVRRIDAVTVGAYYGSDSAGTFVTCLGIIGVLGIAHDSYMPMMLAIMEIPGCLVALMLIAQMRQKGMDIHGNMPGEANYAGPRNHSVDAAHSGLSLKVLHEVFLNPGLFLLFGGIVVGFISGQQASTDPHVVAEPDHLFHFIFKGALCLFLLEMGITACSHLRDMKSAGPGFVVFGVLAPNFFALFGMAVMHAYSMGTEHHFQLGSYALFAVLCGAASYIAVPAIQRLAIPEASPTLPLAASLGLTFTWNVTLGIPIYIEVAKLITHALPVSG